MVVYAKSYPRSEPRTLRQHTEDLLERLNVLRKLIGNTIIERIPIDYRDNFWLALEICCKAHDLGKINTNFQNKILKRLGKTNELINIDRNLEDVPHNLLSCAFIHDIVKDFDKNIQHAIYQAIAFHHVRGSDECSLSDNYWQKVKDVIERDLASNIHRLDDMQDLFNNNIKDVKSNFRKRHLIVPLEGDIRTFYIFLKGLLHRLDHSASSMMCVELPLFNDIDNRVIHYLVNKNIKRENIWQEDIAKKNRNNNVIMIAGTGSGKTEFALLWLNGKGFYTLPIRTSVNAMYERLKETLNSKNIGLLHSDSYFYALDLYKDDHESIELGIKQMDLARQLSMPITVSTADQLFTSVFQYKGYEKIYATLAYSAVIIDEIQSYDPDIVAVILKGLKDIVKLGGKFCLITATLPKLYLDYILEKICNTKLLEPHYRKFKRHRIQVLDCTITDNTMIELIKELFNKYNAVLIITNTVKQAQALYKILSNIKNIPVNLLHSRFIYKDRREKESGKNGIINKQEGIWVTTQLAEVSLNIDFPVLITELSTIDSQIQRWGRVRRNKISDYLSNEPNIYICSSNISGKGSVYDTDLLELTDEVLRNNKDITLSEYDEYMLINTMFCNRNIESTNYYKRFQTSLRLLEDLDYKVESRDDAQKLFRKIIDINILPQQIYDENKEKIEDALTILSESTSKRIDRLDALYTIKQYTVPVPYSILRKTSIQYNNDLILADLKYSKDIGIEYEQDSSSVII